MNDIVVTGADGFVGRALVAHLLETTSSTLTLLDQSFQTGASTPRIRQVRGSLADPQVLRQALQRHPATVYHLASIPGALAEREYQLGYDVNLQASLALAQQLAEQHSHTGTRARLVFASSVAVYGELAAGDVQEEHPTVPAISYGAHKLMTEIALADLSRRAAIDAVSLRLPGIVARPATESGHGSAFMSLIMRKLAAGEPYVCPVPPQATAWWMSLPCCIANLAYAGTMSTTDAPLSRTWQLPVLTLSIEQILEALVRRFGPQCRQLISYQPDERITALFGRYARLDTPAALAAGFRHDGDADQLIHAALQ